MSLRGRGPGSDGLGPFAFVVGQLAIEASTKTISAKPIAIIAKNHGKFTFIVGVLQVTLQTWIATRAIFCPCVAC